MTPFEIDLQDLAAFCATRGVRAWLVGGAARDLIRGAVPADFDLAVDGDGLELARGLANSLGGAFVALDDERATGRAVIPARDSAPALTVDIARLRASGIEGDLRLRDFTVNALAIPLTQALAEELRNDVIDPTGGLADLRDGVLRACGPTSMADDPLRTLRAARIGAALGLRATPELAGQIRAAASGLAGVAAERVRDELLKLLDCPASAPWLRYLDDCGVLTTILPELEPARACEQPRVHFLPVLAHMLETVASLEWVLRGLQAGRLGGDADPSEQQRTSDLSAEDRAALPVAVQTNPGLPRDLPYAEHYTALMAEERGGGRRRATLLKFAALIHDNAKPQTREVHPDGKVSFYGHQEIGADVASEIGRRLRLSRQDSAYVALVVREHMRPGQLRAGEVVTARAVVRFFRDLGDAGPDVLLHELADHMATRGPQLRPDHWQAHLEWIAAMLDAHWGQPDERRIPLLRGTDLIAALGLSPGPQIGALLRAIAEAQAIGEITSREEALALAMKIVGRS